MQVGRYEIVRELGRGGMARVHLARQVQLDRLVALKELLELQREDAEMVGRFVRESRLAGASGRGRGRRIAFEEEFGLALGGTHHTAPFNHPEVYAC